jgi:hypothetical protein
MYIPFLDHLICELEDLLCHPMPRLLAQNLLPANISKLQTHLWEELKEEYLPLLPKPSMVDTELESWKEAIAMGTVSPTADLAHALDESVGLFPNIHTILKVLLTMPVSTATAERSFSALKRLKTYLRNTMGDDRLSALALMHIHRDKNICTDKVLRDFDATGHRRIAIAFK